jgi:hypothetical protein
MTTRGSSTGDLAEGITLCIWSPRSAWGSGSAFAVNSNYHRLSSAVTRNGSLPHSSGAVEGNINRIKMIKRQMYGRANFDLLRKRILHAA